MRNFTHLIFLSVWLLAISAPSAVSLFNNENVELISKIGEEELTEEGLKNVDEKEEAESFSDHLLLCSNNINSNSFYFNYFWHSDHQLEVVLPPPEEV